MHQMTINQQKIEAEKNAANAKGDAIARAKIAEFEE